WCQSGRCARATPASRPRAARSPPADRPGRDRRRTPPLRRVPSRAWLRETPRLEAAAETESETEPEPEPRRVALALAPPARDSCRTRVGFESRIRPTGARGTWLPPPR